ncbi:MAG: transglycosylase domain-containing protein [Anaerolineae bacterium]|nr:transglycosylase domain-containing protein [Anaerolineae bacterium]
MMRRLSRFIRTHPRLTALSAAAVLLLAVVIGAAAVLFTDLPDLANLEAGLALPSTRILDRHGRLLYEIMDPEGGRNRAVTLAQVPQDCIDATIATEDANFYSHIGVAVTGILRALRINIEGGEVLAGGSTITQQVARNLLFDPQQRFERTLVRKLRESILAIRLTSVFSRDDILMLYLNQTYYGSLAYGLEGAAQAYFGTSVETLDLAQCAMLAGLPQAPALYNPLENPEAAHARQQTVLRLMTQHGYITEAEARRAENEPLQYAAAPFPIEAPHFVMSVWPQLAERFPEQLYQGGLTVTTTLDLDWQQAAERAARRHLTRLNTPDRSGQTHNVHNAALVAIDPYTGHVLAMLGSPDYFDESISGAYNAALAPRQPGSALKPFTYAAAFDPTLADPMTAATVLLDVETPFVTQRLESYTPANFGLVEHGPVRIREALASSYNIPAVVALEHVGVDALVRLLTRFGVSTLATNEKIDLAVTLGGGEVRLLELTAAYAGLANGGFHVTPVMITHVADAAGRTLYQWTPGPLADRVLDARVAWLITDILSDNQARTPAFGPASTLQIGRPAAAKTGTTTDYHDNWTMGYTPNLAVGVWVGNADNTPMQDVTGISGAGPIWHDFLREALRGQPELPFEQPEGLTRVEVCALSGLLPTPDCPRRIREWFIPGTEPTAYDTFYQRLAVDRRTGLLADDSTPADARAEQVFVVLPQEARDWAAREGLPQPPQGVELVSSDAQAGLRLLEPDPYTVFRLSAALPPDQQRLRLTVGVSPGTRRVTYRMNGQPIGSADQPPWVVWWPLAVGSHELTAEALLADGTTEHSAPVPFSVSAYVPPEERPTSGTLP